MNKEEKVYVNFDFGAIRAPSWKRALHKIFGKKIEEPSAVYYKVGGCVVHIGEHTGDENYDSKTRPDNS